MTNKPTPNCPYGCGAKGHETVSMGWGPHTLWGCGSYYIHGDSWGWGPQNAEQSTECRDRVIAKQAAEIARLRSGGRRLLGADGVLTSVSVPRALRGR